MVPAESVNIYRYSDPKQFLAVKLFFTYWKKSARIYLCKAIFIWRVVWGVAEGSSIPWVLKLQGDKIQNASCQMGGAMVAKLQGENSASFCMKVSGRKVTGS